MQLVPWYTRDILICLLKLVVEVEGTIFISQKFVLLKKYTSNKTCHYDKLKKIIVH
jgi:hypothetical protein